MDIKTGSQEEIDALERVENKRLASAERKWKIELKDKRIVERRRDILNYLDKSDGVVCAMWCSIMTIVAISLVCMIKITWHYF